MGLHLSFYFQIFQFLYQFFRELFCPHQLQLVSASPSCSMVYFVLYQDLVTYITFRVFFVFFILFCVLPGSLFALLLLTWNNRLAKIRWSVCISKSQKLYASYSPGQIPICAHTTSSYKSCLVLFSFCANFPYLFIMWLIVSFLSTHNLHLLFWSVFGIKHISSLLDGIKHISVLNIFRFY